MFSRWIILIYFKDNNIYKKDYIKSTNRICHSIIQTKKNEICYYEYDDFAICFFDLYERKIKNRINNASGTDNGNCMIRNDILFIGDANKI
jgi:hypothetical protein